MKLCICLEICLSSRFMSLVLWPGMTQLVPVLSQNAYFVRGAWCNSLSFEVILYLISKQIYNSLLKTSKGIPFCPLLKPMSEAFHYLFYSLIKLCYTKSPSDQASSMAPD